MIKHLTTKQKYMLLGAGVITMLVIIITVVLLPRPSSPDVAKSTEQRATQTQTQTEIQTQPIQEVDPTLPPPIVTHFQQELDRDWDAVTFNEQDMHGVTLTKKLLADGSIEYAFPSERQGRQDIIIVNNGIIIFTRQAVVDVSTDNYVTAYGKPAKIIREPSFFNSQSVTYIYLERGIGFTVDPKNGTVFEQYVFEPTTDLEFDQKYKAYIK